MRLLIAAVAFALVPGLASACQFNTDCNVGSTCMKRSGQLTGICMGGMSPGDPNRQTTPYDYQRDEEQRRRQRQQNPLDLNGTEGRQCNFNTECGPGSSCIKESGRMYGVCIRR